MSETEYTRLAEQLTLVLTAVGIINEKLTGYVEFKQDMQNLKTEVRLMKQNCEAVQAAKQIKQVPWGNVKGAVVGGLIVGIIMLIINAIEWFIK
jgi:hypothetical protein